MSVNKAIAQIHDEMETNQNSYVRNVGNFLINYLEIDPGAADNILTEGKTITQSIGAMREVAKENKVDGVGVLSDAEGYEVVLRYYDIDPVDPNEDDFNSDLADFL